MRTCQEYGSKHISEEKKKGFKGYVHAITPDSFFAGTKTTPDGASDYT